MISVFVNSQGYYIKGGGIEITLSCSPNSDYPEQCHIYIMIAKALGELCKRDPLEDIIVYNDSRVIDEMNGVVAPLDQISIDLRDNIRRKILPEVIANVFFRKKNPNAIAQQLARGKQTMIDVPQKGKILEKIVEKELHKNRTRVVRAVDKLKKDWNKNDKRNK